MDAFALYLFKSVIWLTGFALVYLLILRNERYFLLNRIYLVAGILASIIFPLMTCHYTIVIPMLPSVEASDIQAINLPQVNSVINTPEFFSLKTILPGLYIAGSLYLLYRVIRQTITVIRVIRKSEILPYRSAKLIRTNAYPSSFSFFSFVFVNPSNSDTETSEIVNHEMEHVRQRHWIDLVLFELLCTLQWLNPLVWLYGRFIRQNHEFLADQHALQHSAHPAIYRAALINQLFGAEVISLANSFNYSINKKRFHMMTNTIHPPYRKLKLLVILPMIAAVFYAFATPEYRYVQAEKNSASIIQESYSLKENVRAEIQDTAKSSVTTLEGNFIAPPPMGETSPISGFRFSAKSIQGFSGKGSETVKGEDISIDLGNTTSAIYIDGKEATKAEFNQLDPATIKSISIQKGEAAISKYGDKGKNGVILISLKEVSNTSIQVEQMPEFPGGEEALKAYIAANIKYPAIALENGIHGLVYVSFVIDKTGSIPSAKIIRGVDPALDKEALRIVTSMPKWKPGKKNGENVDVTYELPIDFKLPADYNVYREKLRVFYFTGIKLEDQAPEHYPLSTSSDKKGHLMVTLKKADYKGDVELYIFDTNGKLISKEIKNGPTFMLDKPRVSGTYYIYARAGSAQYSGVMGVVISNTTSTYTKAKPKKNAEVKPIMNQSIQAHELIIVPNPTSDRATITLKDSDYNSKLQVDVFDKDGKLIKKDTKTGPTFSLSFANYTSGNYLIVVKAGNNQYSGHLIVNH